MTRSVLLVTAIALVAAWFCLNGLFMLFNTLIAMEYVTPEKINFIKDLLPFILSAITIYMTLLAGRKSSITWLVGLVGQVGWSVWIIHTKTVGLIPLNIALWIVYLYNHYKWNFTRDRV